MTESRNVQVEECDLTLFVACYNEEHGIIPSMETAIAAANEVGCTWDVVVVDDGSKDNSVKVVRDYLDKHPELPITLVVNGVNQGVGVNFAAAAFFGRGKYYRMICGDDTETKETLVKVFSRLGEADMILSYHCDSRARHWMRRVISRVFTFLVNRISGYRIHYYNGLAVHLRKNVMLWHSNAHGFGFQADLITRLLDMGATYIEVPVVPLDRTAGRTSAFTIRNFASVGHTLLELFIRRVAKLLYPNYTSRLKHGHTVYETPAVQKTLF